MRRAHRRRLLASLAATLPVLAALAFAAGELLAPAAPGFGCRVLRNGAVPWLGSPGTGCPLRAYDRVLAVESGGDVQQGDAAAELRRIAAGAPAAVRVLVSRGDEVAWLALELRADDRARRAGRLAAAGLLAAALLGGPRDPLGLHGARGDALPDAERRASRSRRSRPCAVALPRASRSSAIGSGAVPPALVHLALSFPREREIVRRYPALLHAVHALGALLCGICVVNLRALGCGLDARGPGARDARHARLGDARGGVCGGCARSASAPRTRARRCCCGARSRWPRSARDRRARARALARRLQHRRGPAAAAGRLRDRALPALRPGARRAPRHRLSALRHRRERLRRGGLRRRRASRRRAAPARRSGVAARAGLRLLPRRRAAARAAAHEDRRLALAEHFAHARRARCPRTRHRAAARSRCLRAPAVPDAARRARSRVGVCLPRGGAEL